ncbi:hypothetical protein VCHA50P415_30231 [Vibrio chagasii]|nr:hypothetical protein VCHA34P121_20451 [Vibrio chagasii]CAH7155976.1 hypothetical protein VCHA40O231_20373 [Vibrio chagasii]CAH7187315.1 hypothetical protein VCHA43P282_20256 [Vibrio chagasii]CAH7187372.1 hypothetical protein VCHA50P415_30231 [Vibrio chagasii]CAH7292927.1 hypothetical protein VCHA49P379_30193 [Vibrio chagasii]
MHGIACLLYPMSKEHASELAVQLIKQIYMKIRFLIVPLVSMFMGCHDLRKIEEVPNDKLPPAAPVSEEEPINTLPPVAPVSEEEPSNTLPPAASGSEEELELPETLPNLEREPTLVGVDNDDNGIRDDIERYIDNNYLELDQKQAVEQYVKALQQTLIIDLTDINAVKSANRKLSEADHCIYSRFDGSNNSKQPAQVSQELESITTNTKERLLAYLAFARALNGTSWSIPKGDTCE